MPAAVLITNGACPHVQRLCLGEDVRLDPTAWEAIARGAPVIAAIVRNSGRYVRLPKRCRRRIRVVTRSTDVQRGCVTFVNSSDTFTLPPRARRLVSLMCAKASKHYAPAPSHAHVPGPTDEFKLFPSVRMCGAGGPRSPTLRRLTGRGGRSTWAQMPPVRMRGRYPKDATTAKAASGEAPCSKDFSKRAKFTAGIFTLVCPHGKTAPLFRVDCCARHV